MIYKPMVILPKGCQTDMVIRGVYSVGMILVEFS